MCNEGWKLHSMVWYAVLWCYVVFAYMVFVIDYKLWILEWNIFLLLCCCYSRSSVLNSLFFTLKTCKGFVESNSRFILNKSYNILSTLCSLSNLCKFFMTINFAFKSGQLVVTRDLNLCSIFCSVFLKLWSATVHPNAFMFINFFPIVLQSPSCLGFLNLHVSDLTYNFHLHV